MKRFLGAVQFLTVVPVRWRVATSGEAAIFFPLVGALLGASAAEVLYFFGMHLGRPLGALLAVGWLMMITGCLHEDGLADVADAFRAGRSREKMKTILKDSRIGTYGGIVLVMGTLIRWQSLAHCSIDPLRGLVPALAFSRMALVVMAQVAAPVGDGLAQAFSRGCTRPVVAGVIAQAAAFSFLATWRLALTMMVVSGATIWLARIYFVRRLGGVNGDCLGATCQMVEMANLVTLAWQSFI